MELNFRQRLFVAYYLGVACGNATDAARRAGYKSPNAAGQKLTNNADVKAYLEAKLDSVGMTQDELLARTAEIAAFDIGCLIDVHPDGMWTINIERAKKLKQTSVLKKLKFKRETRWEGHDKDERVVTDYVEIEPYSKLDALDKLIRCQGMYKDKVDITSNGGAVNTVLYLPDNGRDPEQRNDNPNDPPAADSGTLPVEPG